MKHDGAASAECQNLLVANVIGCALRPPMGKGGIIAQTGIIMTAIQSGQVNVWPRKGVISKGSIPEHLILCLPKSNCDCICTY